MGSSGWIYFTPYTHDVGQALFQLRQSVYDSGEYVDELRDRIEYLNQLLLRLDPQEQEEELRERLHYLAKTQQDVDVTTINSLTDLIKYYEGLLAQRTIDDFPDYVDFGTHSILDIKSIADQPGEANSVGPLPPEGLMKYFGTLYPTHRDVERNYYRTDGFGHHEYYTNGSGVYFTVYKDQQPDEICFSGVSGGV